MRIPNNQLSDVRVSNLSRVQFSQVKQTLRFCYDDLGECMVIVEKRALLVAIALHKRDAKKGSQVCSQNSIH